MTALTVGSLFSGIGGIDLGLERAGMKVIWQAENDPYCSRVLAKHWPDVPNLGDVTTTDWNHVEKPDLICGGYPCQPFALAGRRRGSADARHLWPYFARALCVLRPPWALLENVPGHVSLGLGDVLADLYSLWYDTRWGIVSAADVGAPHLRKRLFVVGSLADPNEPGLEGRRPTTAGTRPTAERRSAMGDTDRVARTSPIALDRRRRQVEQSEAVAGAVRPGGDHGHTWTVEPDVGRVANGIPKRVDRLRALGNAVVPQVAEHVGRLILDAAGR